VNAVNGSPNSSDSMQSIQNISVGRPGVDVSATPSTDRSWVRSTTWSTAHRLASQKTTPPPLFPPWKSRRWRGGSSRRNPNTPASYQSGGAGVISLVTKSGTNKIHGDIFGEFRPDVLAANDGFNKDSEIANGQANTPPSFYRYQEGGAIGGAIKKDKLFFFGDYEDTQQEQFEGLKTYNAPRVWKERAISRRWGLPSTILLSPIIRWYAASLPRQHHPRIQTHRLALLGEYAKCNYPTPSTCDQATTDLNPVNWL